MIHTQPHRFQLHAELYSMALAFSYAAVTLLSLGWEEWGFRAYAEFRNLCTLKKLVLLEN